MKNGRRKVPVKGRVIEQIADLPCGNTDTLVGVDQFLLKPGTPTTLEDAQNIADMRYSVSLVTEVMV